MAEDVSRALAPLLADLGIELVDVEVARGVLRVTVDRPGGIGLEVLAEATRAVSRTLDDIDPVPGRYTLEVSSPGLERKLRTPEHFARAVGSTVSVRTVGPSGAPLGAEAPARRVLGVLAAADESGITLRGAEVPGGTIRIRYDDVERARTVFEWGPGSGDAGGGRRRDNGAQHRDPPKPRADRRDRLGRP